MNIRIRDSKECKSLEDEKANYVVVHLQAPENMKGNRSELFECTAVSAVHAISKYFKHSGYVESVAVFNVTGDAGYGSGQYTVVEHIDDYPVLIMNSGRGIVMFHAVMIATQFEFPF